MNQKKRNKRKGMAESKEMNKITKKIVQELNSEYDIDAIESAVIRLFLEDNRIYHIKNSLIKGKMRGLSDETFNNISKFFEQNNIQIDLKNIERIFELLIEKNERKINGAFYTPQFIVDYIVNKVIDKPGTVCDPSCGSGAFLVTATGRLKEISKLSYIKTIEEYVYGVDISKRSVERTKLILTLLCMSHGEDQESIQFNIIQNDSLKMDWNNKFPDFFIKESWQSTFNEKNKQSGFDFVVGNPPYVRIQNLDDTTRESIRKKWASARKYNTDLYIPFIELSTRLIKETGKISLITAKSFMDSNAGFCLRKYLKGNRYIDEVLDFNFFQVFEDVITYTNIITLTKTQKEFLRYAKVKTHESLFDLENLKFTKEPYKELPDDKIIINGYRDNLNLKKIKGQPIKIGARYPVKVGIATLRDELYFIEKENRRYLKRLSGKVFEIEPGIVKKVLLANKIQSRKTENIFGWIIFPYFLIGSKYKPIPEHKLQKEFPLCYKYFQHIKSELMNRDKGRTRIDHYGEWYAYGRVQGYNALGKKLVFPGMMPEPRFKELNDDSLFIAGYAIIGGRDTSLLKKIFNSSLFWFYATKEGKKIRNEFYVINKKIIEDFSIPEFTSQEKDFIINENNLQKVDHYLNTRYGMVI